MFKTITKKPIISMHYGPEQPRIQTEVLGLSLICSLVRSHRSLVCLFRTVHTLLRTLARSLTLLLPSSWESELLDHYFFCGFFFYYSDSFSGPIDRLHQRPRPEEEEIRYSNHLFGALSCWHSRFTQEFVFIGCPGS